MRLGVLRGLSPQNLWDLSNCGPRQVSGVGRETLEAFDTNGTTYAA
jgi:hypothetical protein